MTTIGIVGSPTARKRVAAIVWRRVLSYLREEGLGELHEGCENDPAEECALYGEIADALGVKVIVREVPE